MWPRRLSAATAWLVGQRCGGALPGWIVNAVSKKIPHGTIHGMREFLADHPYAEFKAKVEKMAEYVENGARLGWLIDPGERAVHVYRPGAEPQTLGNPRTLSGDPELPGLSLDLAEIWNPPF